MTEQAVPINRQTGERFVRVVKSFLSSEVRWRVLGLSAEPSDAVLEIDGDGAWTWRWTDAEPMQDHGDEERPITDSRSRLIVSRAEDGPPRPPGGGNHG